MKTAVIVGAGRSLGAYLATYLSKNDYEVVVADINIENAQRVADEIKKEGKVSLAVSVDATDEQSVIEMCEKIKERVSTVDLLVYNAGVAVSNKITDFKATDFDFIIDVNLTGYFLCAKHISKMMIDKNTKGRIIQINSKSGKVGSKYNSGYSAAKFGAVGLTQSLALDLAEHEITVNSLMLGNLLNSEMFESLIPNYAIKLGIKEEEVKQYYINKVPLQRGCEFSDIASMVKYYASEEASYCTGQSINITGGQVMF